MSASRPAVRDLGSDRTLRPAVTGRCLAAAAVVAATRPGGLVEVELDEPRCQGCRGACLWRGLSADARARFRTRLRLGVGDRVEVRVPHRYVLLAALVLHGLPLAGLLAGALAGYAAVGGDAAAVAGAALGVALVLLAGRGAARRVEALTLRQVEVRRRP